MASTRDPIRQTPIIYRAAVVLNAVIAWLRHLSEEALRSPISRLLAGKSIATDGSLTKKNLYLEAGVSRATMNRATELLREWDAAVADALEMDPDAQKPLTELRSKPRASRREVNDLRSRLDGAASII